ncbi:MAG: metallophosphoesterase [Bacteroidetes bacterium]|uniref:Metallophosphoesterase n=1 Tax=Candidatus Caccoplasma merdipullorum TaxID=2840718 RepID=A0A9D9H766_9BACT|nr:metallophosphoesterase [Candidatus Caccoplasma merdipullorum]
MRVSLIAVFLLLLLNIAADIYIVKRLPDRCRQGWRRALIWTINTMVYILFTVLMLFVYYKKFDLLMYYLEMIILGFFMLSVPKILFLAISPLDYIPKLFRAKPLKLFTPLSAVIACALPFLLLHSTLYTRKHFRIAEVNICSNKIPQAFDGYKIVQISDMHLKTLYGDTAFINRMVDTINSYNPDIVCFTGDLVSIRSDEMFPYIKNLSRFRAKNGVYSVLGNHDYGDYYKWPSPEAKEQNMQQMKNAQEQMGWNMLNNSSVEIVAASDTIVLIGVENWGKPPFKRYGDLSVSYPALYDDKYKILLTHDPAHWDTVLATSNIDLTLSGHVHAMQFKITLFGHSLSPASYIHDRWSGRYDKDGATLYVNDGIGCTLFPARIGAFPEITVLTLRSEQ